MQGMILESFQDHFLGTTLSGSFLVVGEGGCVVAFRPPLTGTFQAFELGFVPRRSLDYHPPGTVDLESSLTIITEAGGRSVCHGIGSRLT